MDESMNPSSIHWQYQKHVIVDTATVVVQDGSITFKRSLLNLSSSHGMRFTAEGLLFMICSTHVLNDRRVITNKNVTHALNFAYIAYLRVPSLSVSLSLYLSLSLSLTHSLTHSYFKVLNLKFSCFICFHQQFALFKWNVELCLMFVLRLSPKK